MILCLDVGNTQVFGGVFAGDRLISQFRRTSQLRNSSDELGVFFRGVLQENDIDPGLVKKSSSVVWCLTLTTRFGHARKNTSLLIR